MDTSTRTRPAQVVNGIDVEGLKSLAAGVAQDPGRGQTRWRVATTWLGQTRSRAQVEGVRIGGEDIRRSFAIDIDEPCELGGTDRFANPQEHLIAALNACMTVGYAAQCALHGIVLEKLEIETEGDIDLRGFLGLDPAIPRGYEQLRVTVRIKANATREQLAAIHDAVLATSPNAYNLATPVSLTPTLVVE